MSVRRPVRSEIASRGESLWLSYLVVEGPPGSGATTLAARLARAIGGRLVLDRARENPFLQDFLTDSRRYAFKTQLFFTLSRVMQQQETIVQRDLFQPTVVADYLFARDRLFASLTLDDRELALYEKLAGVVERDIHRPDLVIYLQYDSDTLYRRLNQRRDEIWLRLGREYLVAVVEAYNYYFLHYEETPLLIVNGPQEELANSDEALQRLVAELERTHAGVRYYNPGT